MGRAASVNQGASPVALKSFFPFAHCSGIATVMSCGWLISMLLCIANDLLPYPGFVLEYFY